MRRRMFRIVPVLLVVGTSVLVWLTVAAGQGRTQKPNLIVSAAAEPPTFVASAEGANFTINFTVDNQGKARARRRTLTGAYLSVRRKMTAADRTRRIAKRNVPPLGPGKSSTRRMAAEIWEGFPIGNYYLVVCADVRDRVDESSERNCYASGQRVRIGRRGESDPRIGPPGPRGPAGPPGPTGGTNQVVIQRKVLDLGQPTVEGTETRPGDDEGSTQQFELGRVGGVVIRAQCVTTSNGDNEDETDGADADTNPDNDNDGDGFIGVDNDFDTDEDGDEAKILLYLDRPDGTFSFSGPHGKRFNINAGFGPTTTSIEDPADDTGGDGKHMALATARDPEARIVGDADDTDATIGEDTTAPLFEPEDDWEAAFRHGSVYVATSHGAEFILNAYVGVDVLGHNDQCVFGGSVTQVAG